MDTTLAQAFEQFKEIAADIPQDDEVMLNEAWSDYTDGLTKDGALCALQYHYCPGYGETMPDDDREYILESMGLKMTYQARSTRPGAETWPKNATHWHCKLARGSVWSFSFFYSMGSAHTGEPDLSDVMHSLLSDIACDDDFSGFCDDLGFDEDDPNAKKAFKACNDMRVKMSGMFNPSELADLQTLFEDY